MSGPWLEVRKVVLVSLCAVWLLIVSLMEVVNRFWSVSLTSDVSHPCVAMGMHQLRMMLALRLCVCGSLEMSRAMRVDLMRRWFEVAEEALCERFMCAPRSRA